MVFKVSTSRLSHKRAIHINESKALIKQALKVDFSHGKKSIMKPFFPYKAPWVTYLTSKWVDGKLKWKAEILFSSRALVCSFKSINLCLQLHISGEEYQSTVDSFVWFCFDGKTSADFVISQIFDIFTNKLSLFSTQLSFYA